jgi:hypothetical protein
MYNEINKLTSVKKSRIKGDYLVAKTTIQPYVIVALFGKKLLERVDDLKMTSDMKKYGIEWPFKKGYMHVCPNETKFKTNYRANLVNEPYQEVLEDGKIKIFHQNVKYVEDWDSRSIVLMSLKEIKPGEELLWYYGRNYSEDRSYFVYPPANEWDKIEIRNHQIISFETMTALPNWIGFVDGYEDEEARSVWYTQTNDKVDRVAYFQLKNSKTTRSIEIPRPKELSSSSEENDEKDDDWAP